MSDELSDEQGLLARALELAGNGRFRVEPNPLVGAVVVKDGAIVAEGWHARYGGPHAEVSALLRAGDSARGSTVYVTLEPCGHLGKRSPCAHALAAMGVSRVVFSASDPNPKTAGRGPAILREAGIEVVEGILAEESRSLNRRYHEHLQGDLPWTIAKWAMTLDGKIADVDGASRFITGPGSRRLVHEVRGAVDAVAVGIGTVLADDPDLTAREGRAVRSAVRLVIDTRLRTPVGSKVVRTAREVPTWIACGPVPDPRAAAALERAGCRLLPAALRDGRADLGAVFRRLRAEGMERVLLEGGGVLLASAFAAGIVRHVMAFTAPKLLGGAASPTPIAGDGLRRIADALTLEEARAEILGPDVLVEGYVPRD